jgi:acyl-homoserine-lactone acylase
MILVNGSDPKTRWVEDSDSPIPGTMPFGKRPRIERRDYVFNSNDSYWLSSPRQPASGYSALYGPTETARSPRTRMNIRLLENHYGDAGEDGRFNIREIQQALFANRGLSAELLLPELLGLCQDSGAELKRACAVLGDYDGSLNLDSPGAALFREWITRYEYPEMFSAGSLFSQDFDAQNPVETPRGLGDKAQARQALIDATGVLDTAGIALDATLRDTQFAWRAGDPIPVHGGNSFEGVANLQMSGNPSASPIAGVSPTAIADSRYLTDAGYPVVHGSSFIYTLGFDEDGPFAEALLSYSQSGNPEARHFKDQTTLYAEKRWRPVAYKEADVQRTAQSIRILRSNDRR